MLKKVTSSIILILLLLGVLLMIFSIESAKADQESSEAEKSCGLSSVHDLRFAGEQTSLGEEGLVGQPRIVEHRISASELEKMKQEIGVCEDARNYDHTVNGHGAGLRPPTEEEWTQIAANINIVETVSLGSVNQPPSRVDCSTTPWFPPIGDQDCENSCVSWAIGYYVKTFQEAREHGWNLTNARWEEAYPTPEYQDRIISPAFIYHLTNWGVNGWTYYYDAGNVVCSIGACSWAKMPWNHSDQATWPSENAWREAAYYRGASTGLEGMPVNTDDAILNLKNLIASENLAVISVDCTQYSSLTSDDVWTVDNYVMGSNHANTIVGYDDDMAYLEGGQLGKGAFKIANSWGVGGWENVPDGFYWISYKAMMQKIEYVMFYRDRIGYAPTLTASFRVEHPMRGECSVIIGVGTHDNPTVSKRFTDYIEGGDQPFCPNNIIFDITEFKDVVSNVCGQPFFISVLDGWTSATGTILYFAVENTVSSNPPITTVDYEFVFADLILKDLSYTVVCGLDDQVYYRFYNFSEAIWHSWASLSTGSTGDGSAAAVLGNELHIVVRGMDGYTLWHGYVNLTDNVFSGWTLLSGATSSAPTLTSNGTALCLVVRGLDNRVYYRCYSEGSWGLWDAIPTGATCDTPSAAMLGNDLHIVVRGMDGNSLWHTKVSCDGFGPTVWTPISGATPSRPAITASQSSGKLHLVVRGLDNRIWRTEYASSWGGWTPFPTGATCDGPGATIMDNGLQIVVRGMDGNSLWCCHIDLSSGTLSPWTQLDGSTLSAPTLTS